MGELKQIKVNVTIDAFAQMKADRKKKIFENKRVKDAITKNKIEYKETVVADSKKWNPNKLKDEFEGSVYMMLKMFDTRMAFVDKEPWSKKLEDKVIKKYDELAKSILNALDEKAEALENDKPDDTKLKKGVDVLGKVDGRVAQSAYSAYLGWMKKCEKKWDKISKLEEELKKHSAEHEKLSGEASNLEKDSNAKDDAAKAKAGADKMEKVIETLTKKRDALLGETKSLYKEETAKLFKDLESVVSQMGQVISFAGEMKRNAQISEKAQDKIQSGKGFFKGITAQEAVLKRAQREFDTQMTKLERAKKAESRPSHKDLLIPPAIAKNIEGVCQDAEDMHKTLKNFYTTAKKAPK